MKMKILLTATVQSHICQFHKPLVELLHEHGCEVHVAAKDNLDEKNGLKLDFVDKIYNIPFARSPKSKNNIQAYKELKRIINKEHYDIIHCNTPMGGIVTRLAARGLRKSGIKVYYTAHGFHFYKGAPKKNWIIFYPIEKIFSRFTDTLITITNEDFCLAKKNFYCNVEYIHGVGVNEKRYCFVNYENQRNLRKELGYLNDQKIILCIGELLPNKNQIMAVQMMQIVVKKYPNAKLIIAGNGPERNNLMLKIHDYNLEKNVDMIGYCTCLEKYQQAADVLVSCSFREGLPLNLVEAMMSGNPVVASINRGHIELIENGKNGFLVKNMYEMADKVISILDNNYLKNEMGIYAREIIKDYSSDNVKKELEKIYFP